MRNWHYMQQPIKSDDKDDLLRSKTHTNSQIQKPLNWIGMAKKAGLLAIGSDTVKTATRTEKAKLIALTSDISEKSAEHIKYNSEITNTICIDTPYTKFEFGRVAGRGSPGVVAFLDLGLATEFMKALTVLDEERYGRQTSALINKMNEKMQSKRGTL